MVASLPNVNGSVDGGKEHGIGTFGGALGAPLMIGFLCMLGTTVAFYVMSLGAKAAARKLYYVAMSVTGIAAVAYLCMRANIGINYVECAGHSCEGDKDPYVFQTSNGKTYPLFWMRYIDWFFTTPFFLLDICLLAKADVWETFFVMLMNALCIICGAVGALKPSINVPMFVLGMLTFCAFIHRLHKECNDDHSKFVMRLTMLIWCAYPVMFFVCEMEHLVTTEVEVWMYMVLDVAAKCGCGILLVLSHAKTPEGQESNYGAVL